MLFPLKYESWKCLFSSSRSLDAFVNQLFYLSLWSYKIQSLSFSTRLKKSFVSFILFNLQLLLLLLLLWCYCWSNCSCSCWWWCYCCWYSYKCNGCCGCFWCYCWYGVDLVASVTFIATAFLDADVSAACCYGVDIVASATVVVDVDVSAVMVLIQLLVLLL